MATGKLTLQNPRAGCMIMRMRASPDGDCRLECRLNGVSQNATFIGGPNEELEEAPRNASASRSTIASETSSYPDGIVGKVDL